MRPDFGMGMVIVGVAIVPLVNVHALGSSTTSNTKASTHTISSSNKPLGFLLTSLAWACSTAPRRFIVDKSKIPPNRHQI